MENGVPLIALEPPVRSNAASGPYSDGACLVGQLTAYKQPPTARPASLAPSRQARPNEPGPPYEYHTRLH